MPSVGTLVCVIVSGTAVHLFHCQWYVDESFPSISSVVRWYISLHAFIGTLVCVIVSGTAVHLFISGTSMNHFLLYHQWYGGIYLFHASSGTLVCVIVS